MIPSAVRVKLAFGLACNIERADTDSGFRAMLAHPQSKEDLFAQPRLAGFANLLKTGFAERLIILGRDEEGTDFNQSKAICRIIQMDYGVESGRAVPADSGYGTAEAADFIKSSMEAQSISSNDAAVITSFYHLPRTQVQLQDRGVFLKLFPAEAFTFLKRSDPDRWSHEEAAKLIEEFGGGAYESRNVSEIIGIARMIGGLYKPQGLAKNNK